MKKDRSFPSIITIQGMIDPNKQKYNKIGEKPTMANHVQP